MDVNVFCVLLSFLLYLTASDRASIRTPTNLRYRKVFTTRPKTATVTNLLFSVKACKDAHIGLLKKDPPLFEALRYRMPGNPYGRLYEIALGAWDNSISVLRTARGKNEVDKHTGSVLECHSFKDFWLSFNNKGHVDVGRGHDMGKDVILSYHKSFVSGIKFIAITTGFHTSGEWILELLEHPNRDLRFKSNPRLRGTTFVTESVFSKAHCCVRCSLSISCTGFVWFNGRCSLQDGRLRGAKLIISSQSSLHPRMYAIS